MAKKLAVSDIGPLSLPCLRGRMGDWFYYITILSFEQASNRISLPEEIDKKYSSEDLMLGDWIQRKIEKGRIQTIADYLRNQPQRFFNSLILGIFGGSPSWQEISMNYNQVYSEMDISEDRIDYFSRTFGILNLTGKEDIFAIDGQHRVMGIRAVMNSLEHFQEDEIPVIFVAHRTDTGGKIRTRRLFSTLNKYAKPVSLSEIIALSEDNNCAIITRHFVDNYKPFAGKILVQKNRSISPENTSAFTNIMILNDIIERIITDKKVYGFSVKGKRKNRYITERESEQEIKSDIKLVELYFNKLIQSVPSIKNYFNSSYINRKDKKTNLFFRPIGQNIVFDTLKIAETFNRFDHALSYFSKDNFNLENKIWNTIFWDSDTETILTDKSRQRYATYLIVEKIGIKPIKTKKDVELYDNFGFSSASI